PVRGLRRPPRAVAGAPAAGGPPALGRRRLTRRGRGIGVRLLLDQRGLQEFVDGALEGGAAVIGPVDRAGQLDEARPEVLAAPGGRPSLAKPPPGGQRRPPSRPGGFAGRGEGSGTRGCRPGPAASASRGCGAAPPSTAGPAPRPGGPGRNRW